MYLWPLKAYTMQRPGWRGGYYRVCGGRSTGSNRRRWWWWGNDGVRNLTPGEGGEEQRGREKVRMVRETACGRTGGEGGSNAGGMAYWGGGRPAKRATVETTAAATATTAAVKGGGVADRACNIGAEGRWVCVHVHASLNPDPRLHA